MAKKRKRIKKEYTGTDGLIYKGKAIKARKRLESRQLQWAQIMNRNKSGKHTEGYRRPGSMAK